MEGRIIYKQKILIVDDEINILRALKRLLKQYNLETLITTSSEEALEIIENNSIDLVISDQRMPKMTGIELLLKVKKNSPGTIRILMSGYSDTDVFINAINNGIITYYIAKPWVNEEIVKIIYNALETKNEQTVLEKALIHLLKDNNKWEDLISKAKLVRRKDLLNRIIHDQMIVSQDVIEEARNLDLILDASLFCSLLVLSNNSASTDNHLRTNFVDPLLKDEIIAHICLAPNCLAWDCGGMIGVLHQVDTDGNEELIFKEVSSINDTLDNYYPDLEVTIGVSKINTGPDSVKNSYHQAQTSLVAAKLQDGPVHGIYYFHDVGVLQLLTAINKQVIANDFVKDNLEKLIQYDYAKGTEFVNTLQELLRYDNLKETAANLFIHPKTLVFRRNRIEEILGVSLNNYETKLNLGIAIKLYNISKHS
ncbi:MAG: hypothetical protein APF84_16820 [Gracilibacter sp. BRH_c7a]|nr:MAG: hypothetical protein APF84_16820 [Gracilibacter sp. BRH_c7a]